MSNNYEDEDEIVGSNSTGSTNVTNVIFKLPKGVEYLKFDKEKLNKIDIIPFINKDGKKQVMYRYEVHKGVGPSHVSVVCNKKMLGKNCPVCSAQDEILEGKKYKDSTEAKQKLFKSFYPRERVIMNVMYEGKHYVWDASDYKVGQPLDRAAVAYQESEALAKFVYASPTNGYTVTVNSVKTENPFKDGDFFMDVENFGFRERKEQYEASIVDTMVKLDQAIQFQSDEVIEALLYGGSVPSQNVIEDDEEELITETKKAPEPVKKEVIELAKNPEAKKGLCAGGGHFGDSFDKLDHCENCDDFRACRKKNKELADNVL